MQTIPLQSDQIGPALYAVAAALVAVAGFVGFIIRWMMSRIDASQSKLAEAVDAMAKAISLWQEAQRDAQDQRDELMRTQLEILRHVNGGK